MIKAIKNLSSDKLAYRGFIISFLLTFFLVLFVVLFYKKLPPYIPVFNQLPWGEQRIAPTIEIFIPVAIFFVIFITNIIFTSLVYPKNPLIARFVAATTLLIAVLNFIYIIKTVITVI